MAIWKTLLDGLKSAVELKIVTYVGDVTLSGSDICKPETQLPVETSKVFVTCVNLAAGDITTCMPKEHALEEWAWIRNYHQEQVKQGREIVDTNLRLIGELGERLATAIAKLKETEGA